MKRFSETETASSVVYHWSTEYQVYPSNQLLTVGLIVPLEEVTHSSFNGFISLSDC